MHPISWLPSIWPLCLLQHKVTIPRRGGREKLIHFSRYDENQNLFIIAFIHNRSDGNTKHMHKICASTRKSTTSVSWATNQSVTSRRHLEYNHWPLEERRNQFRFTEKQYLIDIYREGSWIDFERVLKPRNLATWARLYFHWFIVFDHLHHKFYKNEYK